MRTDARGLALTIAAFAIWGFSPIFWKFLLAVPATQLLSHRILWAALMLGGLLLVQGRFTDVRAALRSKLVVATLMVTTVAIATNWLLYIWAVVTERVLQVSLGYYINPLVTILLAMVFLGERLRRLQWWSVAFAAAGVAVLVWRQGSLPWISLVLAFSFGLYGLLRKQVRAEAEVGLFVETAFLSPLVVVYLARAEAVGTGAFLHQGIGTDVLLVASGALTAVPLVLFTRGARKIPLSTAGFLQFLAPTIQFLLAVFLYDETFTGSHLAAFGCIWVALALFSWDLKRQWQRSRLEVSRAARARTEPVASRSLRGR